MVWQAPPPNFHYCIQQNSDDCKFSFTIEKDQFPGGFSNVFSIIMNSDIIYAILIPIQLAPKPLIQALLMGPVIP